MGISIFGSTNDGFSYFLRDCEFVNEFENKKYRG